MLEQLQWRASLVHDEYRDQLLAHPEAVVLPLEHILQGHVLVAEFEEQIAGFAVVLPGEAGMAELDGLFVEPSLHGQGVGRQLTEAGATLARSQGSRRLLVVAGPAGAPFYQRLGFTTVRQQDTRFGPAVLMERAI
ncbi:MAG: GNAT family N-acetyltransferase [Caulobacteraceae bacterium]|nr:GNAT family N-acetyltransferase [Caulobacteraceae bacterium]